MHNAKRKNMKYNDLKQRTKEFALRIIKLVESLSKSKASDIIGRQLLRSGTSVAANYRSACRAKSRADFISKMGTVEEETDESIFWLEILVDSRIIDEQQVNDLRKEANEILAIIVASINTAKRRKMR